MPMEVIMSLSSIRLAKILVDQTFDINSSRVKLLVDTVLTSKISYFG
jgi:hypothetical protein